MAQLTFWHEVELLPRPLPDLRVIALLIGKRWAEARCAHCGTRLAVGERSEPVVDLALRNVTARPCCDRWRMTPPA